MSYLTVPSATQIISDGNTVAWYDYAEMSTLSLTADSSVSRWNDKLGSGHDLIQDVSTAKPKWTSNGILFDGIDDYMKTNSFTYNQPESIYLVFKQLSETAGDYVFDGNDAKTGSLRQYGSGGNLQARAGSDTIYLSPNNSLSLNTWGIINIIFNNIQSKFSINKNIVYWDASIGNMGGFTLGGYGSSGTYLSNIQVKEIILRNVADDKYQEGLIYNYLSKKYSI